MAMRGEKGRRIGKRNRSWPKTPPQLRPNFCSFYKTKRETRTKWLSRNKPSPMNALVSVQKYDGTEIRWSLGPLCLYVKNPAAPRNETQPSGIRRWRMVLAPRSQILTVESRRGAASPKRDSPPRSSNRTCGFPASGFPTGFMTD